MEDYAGEAMAPGIARDMARLNESLAARDPEPANLRTILHKLEDRFACIESLLPQALQSLLSCDSLAQ